MHRPMLAILAGALLAASSAPAPAAPFPEAGMRLSAHMVCTQDGINRFMADGEMPIYRARNRAEFDVALQSQRNLMEVLRREGTCVFLELEGVATGFSVVIVKPLTNYVPLPSRNAVAAVQITILGVPDPRWAAWKGREAGTVIHIPIEQYDEAPLDFVASWPPPTRPVVAESTTTPGG